MEWLLIIPFYTALLPWNRKLGRSCQSTTCYWKLCQFVQYISHCVNCHSSIQVGYSLKYFFLLKLNASLILGRIMSFILWILYIIVIWICWQFFCELCRRLCWKKKDKFSTMNALKWSVISGILAIGMICVQSYVVMTPEMDNTIAIVYLAKISLILLAVRLSLYYYVCSFSLILMFRKRKQKQSHKSFVTHHELSSLIKPWKDNVCCVYTSQYCAFTPPVIVLICNFS